MTLDELQRISDQFSTEQWEIRLRPNSRIEIQSYDGPMGYESSKVIADARTAFPKLLAVARAAKLVYPSDSPGQEDHELFNALSDALAALEAT